MCYLSAGISNKVVIQIIIIQENKKLGFNFMAKYIKIIILEVCNEENISVSSYLRYRFNRLDDTGVGYFFSLLLAG